MSRLARCYLRVVAAMRVNTEAHRDSRRVACSTDQVVIDQALLVQRFAQVAS